jgi:hypothetical protein
MSGIGKKERAFQAVAIFEVTVRLDQQARCADVLGTAEEGRFLLLPSMLTLSSTRYDSRPEIFRKLRTFSRRSSLLTGSVRIAFGQH